MQEKDKKEFATILMTLAECFTGKDKPSKPLMEIYFRALFEYDIEDIQGACNILVRTWTFHFLPKPADFIKHIVGSEGDQALEQWQYVLEQISSKGVNRAEFDTATTKAINACGGMEAIGHLNVDKLTFKCKEFIENYKITSRREQQALSGVGMKELMDGIKDYDEKNEVKTDIKSTLKEM
jgi:hypothetical protein